MSKINYIPFERSYGGREKYYSVGKQKDLVGDCAIRAVALALDQDYKETFREMSELGVEEFGEFANSTSVIEEYLSRKGWRKISLKEGKEYKPFYDHRGIIQRDKNYIFKVRAGYGSHLSAVVRGVNKDTWLCQDKKASFYWVK